MPTTDSNEELRKILVDYASIDDAELGEDKFCGHYNVDRALEAITSHIQAIGEEIIGPDLPHEKMHHTFMNNACTSQCHGYGNKKLAEQRQRLARYLGERQ